MCGMGNREQETAKSAVLGVSPMSNFSRERIVNREKVSFLRLYKLYEIAIPVILKNKTYASVTFKNKLLVPSE